jgi:hypothetical protein
MVELFDLEDYKWFKTNEKEIEIRPYDSHLFEWGTQYVIKGYSIEELMLLVGKMRIIILGLNPDAIFSIFDEK